MSGDIKIVPAPRPDDESRASWRALIRESLRNKEGEQLDFDRHEFVPCFTCSSLPGTPSLCRGCLANRQTITELREAAEALADASDHCRGCRDCGDGPCCCDNCVAAFASERVGQILGGR